MNINFYIENRKTVTKQDEKEIIRAFIASRSPKKTFILKYMDFYGFSKAQMTEILKKVNNVKPKKKLKNITKEKCQTLIEAGYSIRRAAKQLNCSPGTVRNRLLEGEREQSITKGLYTRKDII